MMYQLVFYVPIAQAEAVKEAVFAAGGGALGDYSHCAFETLGKGQFKPLKGANPAIGQIGQLERVDELRVELVVEDARVRSVLEALVNAHPYEEPAYQVWPVLTLSDF